MQKVHFIGIGGIGISALARHYQANGWEVSGSDTSQGEVVELLMRDGIAVHVGPQTKENIPKGVNKIIYTIAVTEENEEFKQARILQKENEVTLQSYPEALGQMSKEKKVISICGTHGKTTTTAMTYYALKNAGLKVSMIVGSLIEVDGKKTNYVNGGDDFLIIESCEYRRSFLNYHPEIILVTNIDNDHMDYFKDFQDVKNAFQDFINQAGKTVILHENEKFLETPVNVEKIICEDFSNENGIELAVPGAHNRKNAELVVALGEFLKLDKQKIFGGLLNFKGTWRRQEYKGNFFGADFYDDYGHHPTEVKATLAAFREKYPSKKILAIFQPHLFSRTKLLFTDFVNSFSDADEVVILPIYPSREKFDESINSGMIVEEISKLGKVASVVPLQNLAHYLEQNVQEDNVVITLGAGDIYKIYQQLPQGLELEEVQPVLAK